jgi:HNH endonuclease
MERFWNKVNKNTLSGCWEWSGSLKCGGYGLFRVKGRLYKAHRFSWILNVGSIPKGKLVCHKCDNPKCVNPAHLFLGTHTDNARDRENKNRRPIFRGEAHPNSSLSDCQAVAIVEKYKTGRYSCRALAKEYDVASSTIHRLITKQTWRHL